MSSQCPPVGVHSPESSKPPLHIRHIISLGRCSHCIWIGDLVLIHIANGDTCVQGSISLHLLKQLVDSITVGRVSSGVADSSCDVLCLDVEVLEDLLE